MTDICYSKPNSLAYAAGAALLILVALGSCNIFGAPKPKAQNSPSLPVYRVDTATAVVTKDFLGTIEGKVNVEIRPQVEGQLEAIYVDEGDFVQKGQRLFRINPQPYQELLNNAVANENVEKAKLENARIELERIRPLVENEVISEVRLRKAQSDYDIAKASLAQSSAAVATAKINMGYTTLTAPVSGYIGRIPKRIGNLVSSRDAEPITVLTDVHEVYVYFSMSESDFFHFSKINKQASDSLFRNDSLHLTTFRPEVSLTLADGTEYPEKGIVDAVAGQINKNTGAVVLRASFPNEQNILRSGNTGTLKMEEAREGQILIPQQATLQLQDRTFVMKMDSQHRVLRQVIQIAGSTQDDYIVSSGLSRGDVIITEGLDQIADSTRITPLYPSGPQPTAGAVLPRDSSRF